ncbi:MAG: ABC transporter ATP-binding protein [Sumerlaeia bacterium]
MSTLVEKKQNQQTQPQGVFEKLPPANVAARCRGVVKSFGEGQAKITVLREVDFQARRGEMTFLVGPSGCGKTTLISILGGILHCEGGEIQVLENDIQKMKRGKLADFRLANLGFIFQQFNLLPALTVSENVAIPLIAAGMKTSNAINKSCELLGRLGLDAQTQQYPTQLSGGQQQRVAIARSLVHEPELIICDEPTSSLDAGTGQLVMELLRKFALEGERSVIVVTHDNRIYDYADRIVYMADGIVERVEKRHGSDRASVSMSSPL